MKKSTRMVLGAILVLFPLYILIQLFVPVYSEDTAIEVEIPPGMTYRQAVDLLMQKKLIRDPFLFRALGTITGADRKMRAGYYSFWSRISPSDVFNILRKGKIIEYDVTVIEGESLEEIAKKLEARRFVGAAEFTALARDEDFVESLDIDAPSLEGYLFPDTYRLPKGVSARDIARLMVGRMRDVFDDEMKMRMKKLGWSEREVLTMASIVELEAEVDSERPVISGVYHNRLRRGMPLQADPTAIYGVKMNRARITLKDLRNRTAYNTYVIRGLPPGPIASPGAKSIKAALFPADVPYIYFVSRGDGSHIFTKSLKDHNDAISQVRAARDKAAESQGS